MDPPSPCSSRQTESQCPPSPDRCRCKSECTRSTIRLDATAWCGYGQYRSSGRSGSIAGWRCRSKCPRYLWEEACGCCRIHENFARCSSGFAQSYAGSYTGEDVGRHSVGSHNVELHCHFIEGTYPFDDPIVVRDRAIKAASLSRARPEQGRTSRSGALGACHRGAVSALVCAAACWPPCWQTARLQRPAAQRAKTLAVCSLRWACAHPGVRASNQQPGSERRPFRLP